MADPFFNRLPVLRNRDPENVRVVPNPRGGWDVVMLIDGHYSDKADAERLAEFWRDRFMEWTA